MRNVHQRSPTFSAPWTSSVERGFVCCLHPAGGALLVCVHLLLSCRGPVLGHGLRVWGHLMYITSVLRLAKNRGQHLQDFNSSYSAWHILYVPCVTYSRFSKSIHHFHSSNSQKESQGKPWFPLSLTIWNAENKG